MKAMLNSLACFTALMASAGALSQGAENYPSRPVTMIVPFAPGAATDLEGRIYATRLSEVMGQQFLLDFKPGGSMTLGLTQVARQKPDGHTLIFVTSTYSLLPLMFRDLPYDPIRNFAQVSLLSKRGTLLVVSNNLPVRNVQEYVAYARVHPGEINFATSGNGTIQHLLGLWLTSQTNTKVTFVHYKSAAAGYPDIMAGRTHMIPVAFSGGYPVMVAPGKARAIGIASLQRSVLLPELPTVAEQGVPEFEYPSWLGLLATEKTPAAIINKLQTELAKIIKQPDIQQKLGGETTLIASTPEQFRRIAIAETERWQRLLKENNIRIDEAN